MVSFYSDHHQIVFWDKFSSHVGFLLFLITHLNVEIKEKEEILNEKNSY